MAEPEADVAPDVVETPVPETEPESAPEPEVAQTAVAEEPKEPVPAEADEDPSKPKRRGWWSLGGK